MAPRSYADKDLKLLWGLAAGRCAFPGCRRECILEPSDDDPTAVIGKVAHIAAHSDTGPRADPTMLPELRNKYDNLLLLCPTDHDTVDVQPNTYTVAHLRSWKAAHEQWVRESFAAAMPDVSFAELEIVTKGLLAAPGTPTTEFQVTAPRLKMERNGLTERVLFSLTMGLAKAREVENFIAAISGVAPDFAESLKAGFVQRYVSLRGEGLDGDDLFDALYQFATSRSRDFNRQAAGLAVLCYLFEKCEVFEP